MKQHITKKQMDEIGPIDAMVFCGWDRKECEKIEADGGCVYFDGDETDFNIGSMIEFLEKKDSNKTDFAIHCWQEYAGDSVELVDYLWEACKEVLEGKVRI
jgi:hypothetical protein